MIVRRARPAEGPAPQPGLFRIAAAGGRETSPPLRPCLGVAPFCVSPFRRETTVTDFNRIAAAGLAAIVAAAPAGAETFTFEAVLNNLSGRAPDDPSGLGGSAKADLVFDSIANTLDVRIAGSGFAPDMLHVQHIHGRFDAGGAPRDSVSPTLANDADGDGVVELLEGAPLYGGILFFLNDEAAAAGGDPFDGFPSAPNGIIDFDATYDLTTTGAFNSDPNGDGDTSDAITAADLFPLDLREIVIHGAFLEPGIGGLGNEGPGNSLFDNGGYSNFVPVAAGQIVETTAPIPLPAAGWLMIAGIGGIAALRRGRRA